MLKAKFFRIVLSLGLLLMLLTGIVSAQAEGTTVAGGLNGPQGILVAPDGTIWVADSGLGGETELPFKNPQTGEDITAQYGDTAQIVSISPDGSQEVAANLPSVVAGMDTLGVARLALVDGTVYATSGQFLGDETATAPIPNIAAVVRLEDGEVVEVANAWEFERTQNPDGGILDSHPYGLAAGPDGSLYVTDAAANDLLRVDPATGDIELVAVFEGLPSPLPNPTRGGAMESDPVPTGVAIDDAGNIFVSLLGGFPFVPGATKVVQVTPDGQVSDYATGLTTLTDVEAAPDGNLYAVQFGEFTDQGPTPNSGRIIRVQQGDASEVVVDGLSFPTSIDFNENGDAYIVTGGVGAPGSGEVVMFANLTALPGTPLTEEEAPVEAEAETEAAETEAEPAAEAQPAAAEEQPQAAPAQETPATLPQAGGEQSTTEQAGQILLGLGIVLFTSGLFLKRRFWSRSQKQA